MTRTTRFAAALGCCLILLIHSSVTAGILSGHGDVYDGWTGTASFNNGTGLAGDVDYAVFTAADFTANFGGQGYVPGDDYVYTYQIFNTGADVISALVVGPTDPANTIGTFNSPAGVNGDVDSFVEFFSPPPPNANWVFALPGIASGDSSWGLAYSSPNAPRFGDGTIIDGGTMASLAGLLPVPVPEPTGACLVAIGGALFGLLRRRSG